MDEYLSTKEYADLHGVSRRTVQRWIAQGLIFGVKIGRSIKIPIDEQPPSSLQETSTNLDDDETTEDKEFFADSEGTFPTETTDFSPEEVDEDTDECGGTDGIEVRAASSADPKNLRRIFAFYEDAQAYADEIPVATEIFRRAEDCYYQVEVIGSP